MTKDGGEHYKKRGIQPIEYIQSNSLDFFEGNVVKYVTRHKDKNGPADIIKARDYLNMMLDMYDNGMYANPQSLKGVSSEN